MNIRIACTQATEIGPEEFEKRSKLIVNRNLISIFVIIDLLDPLNIEARYPSYKEKLMKSLTQEKCITLIEQTKKLQQWIKTKL